MRIAHVSTMSSNLDHANRFFSDLLGFSKIKDFSIDAFLTEKIFGLPVNCRIIVFKYQGQEVEVFIPENYPQNRDPFAHLCLELNDAKAFIQLCEKEGLPVNLINKGDKVLTFIEDFDGNLYEIKQAPHGERT